jgi:hypothetical protein
MPFALTLELAVALVFPEMTSSLILLTVKWTLLNDDGDEITIHLHNSPHVPDAPMCLLSPQHMAQQTTSSTDGFDCKWSFNLCWLPSNNPIQCL